jgi:hypothetical protein
MALFSPPPQRETLALSFEQTEHGFLYYHYAWSRGIPVTPEEREAYLDIPVFGLRHTWRRSLAGRETAPPRAYWPTLWKLLRTMPLSMAFIVLNVGAVGVLFGLYEPNIALAVVYTAFGCAMLLFSGAIVASRFRRIPR